MKSRLWSHFWSSNQNQYNYIHRVNSFRASQRNLYWKLMMKASCSSNRTSDTSSGFVHLAGETSNLTLLADDAKHCVTTTILATVCRKKRSTGYLPTSYTRAILKFRARRHQMLSWACCFICAPTKRLTLSYQSHCCRRGGVSMVDFSIAAALFLLFKSKWFRILIFFDGIWRDN